MLLQDGSLVCNTTGRMFGQTEVIEENTLISETDSIVQASVDAPLWPLERISSSPHFNVITCKSHQLLSVVPAAHGHVESAGDSAKVFYLNVYPCTQKIC